MEKDDPKNLRLSSGEDDSLAIIARHYNVSEDTVRTCVEKTKEINGSNIHDIYKCVESMLRSSMDLIGEVGPTPFLPLDMTQAEILYRLGSDYIFSVCSLNKRFARECKSAVFWFGYLRDKDTKEWMNVIKRIPWYGDLPLFAVLFEQLQRRDDYERDQNLFRIECLVYASKVPIADSSSIFDPNNKHVEYMLKVFNVLRPMKKNTRINHIASRTDTILRILFAKMLSESESEKVSFWVKFLDDATFYSDRHNYNARYMINAHTHLDRHPIVEDFYMQALATSICFYLNFETLEELKKTITAQLINSTMLSFKNPEKKMKKLTNNLACILHYIKTNYNTEDIPLIPLSNKMVIISGYAGEVDESKCDMIWFR